MKIAFYSPAWPADSVSNGIVTYLEHIVPALRDMGHEVFVITPDARSSSKQLIDLKEYKKRPSFWHRILFKTAKRKAIFKYSTMPLVLAIKDLIDNHGIEIFEMEESFGFSEEISKLKQIPVVVRLHGPWFLNKRYEDSPREKQEASALRVATIVTAPTNAVTKATSARFPKLSTQISTIMNPISVDRKNTWARTPHNENKLLFIGRFDKIKGADLALLAFNELAKSNPKLSLTIVGPDHGVDANGETFKFPILQNRFCKGILQKRYPI